MKKKKNLIIVCVIAAIVIAVVVMAAVFGGQGDPQPTDPTTQTTQPATEGTDPSESTAPSEGTDITDPTGPEQTDPTDPADPTKPIDPTDPVDPTDPTEPVETNPTAPDHTHDYVKETVEPTCADKGYTIYTCACGDSYTADYVNALGHSYTTVVTAPTCDQAGYTTYTCTDCDHSYQGDTVKAKGHKYGNWGVTKEATCETEGTQSRTCSTCGKMDTQKIEAVGHEFEDGTVVAATCDEDGYIEGICAVCGKETKETISATGHVWGEWEVTIPVTATSNGEKIRTCSVCGDIACEIIPSNHKHEYVMTYVEPTCDSFGKKVYTCECGRSYDISSGDPIGHNWSEWDVTQEPTTESVGWKQRTCSNCHETAVEAIPALDPVTGEAYQQYLDPRITVTQVTSKVKDYTYENMTIGDARTWGEPPSIWITDEGSMQVLYYDRDGNAVEFTLDPPTEEHIIYCYTIIDDGTYVFSVYGRYY